MHETNKWNQQPITLHPKAYNTSNQSLSYLVTQSLNQSTPQSLSHWVTQPLSHSVTDSLSHSIAQPLCKKNWTRPRNKLMKVTWVNKWNQRPITLHPNAYNTSNQSLSYLVTQSLNQSPPQSLSHWVTQPLSHSVTEPLNHSIAQPLCKKTEWDREANGWKLHWEIHATNDQSPYIPMHTARPISHSVARWRG